MGAQGNGAYTLKSGSLSSQEEMGDIAKAFVAGLVGFGLGCAIINATSGQSLAAARHSIDMAQYTAPRTPAFLPYQVAAETRPSLRGSPGELLVAPSLTFVKSEFKIDEDKRQGISTKNYNSVTP